MRVWDIHPGYLSRQSLLGQHAEIHALSTVIADGKNGYAMHPETLRWKGRLGKLKRSHDLTILEMELRAFNHYSPLTLSLETDREDNPTSCDPIYVDHPLKQVAILSKKYLEREQAGRIPLPKNGYEFWAHHKYSVMARGYNHYKEIQAYFRNRDSCPLEESGVLIEEIIKLMELPVIGPALANVADHIWGYFKHEASKAEKERYLRRQPDNLPALIPFFYELAKKYKRAYLLHSTIFADFTGAAEIYDSTATL